MFDVVRLAKDIRGAVLADPEHFYTKDTGAWVAGLPRPGDIRVTTGREPFWINLGYWRDVEHVDENNCERVGELFRSAQAGMAHTLARTARLGQSDVVLDCGFGYGDQDILWAEEYHPARIAGLNVTPNQVRIGRERVRLTGLEKVVDLELGSATQMPFGPGEFDVVFALEAAMHFKTRRAFLREAFRVLRPKGRLVLSDMLQKTDREAGVGLLRHLRHRFFRRRIAFMEENVWALRRYDSELKEAGFQNVRIESIGEEVYPPAHTAFAALGGVAMAGRQPDKAAAMAQVRESVRRARQTEPEQFQWQALFNCDDYAIVYAEKP